MYFICVCYQLHHSLQQKRAGQVLNMEEISTRLAGLRGTVIAMPGLHANSVGPVSLLHILTCTCVSYCDSKSTLTAQSLVVYLTTGKQPFQQDYFICRPHLGKSRIKTGRVVPPITDAADVTSCDRSWICNASLHLSEHRPALTACIFQSAPISAYASLITLLNDF